MIPKKDDLYIIQSDKTGAIKIGRTKNIKRRLKQLQTGSPYCLKIILLAEGMGHLEQKLHKDLAALKIRRNGEWFPESTLSYLPNHLYELIEEDILENPDWWNIP